MFAQKFVEGLVAGLQIGSIYALIALGYTMVYGIVKLINFAHGEIIMIGAFVALAMSNLIGANPFTMIISMIASSVVCALVAILVEKIAYKPLRNLKRITSLITAIAMSYLIQNVFMLIEENQQTSPSFIKFPRVNFGNASVDLYTTLFTVGVSILLMVGLMVFVKKTRIGKSMRAVSENMDAAKLMGVNVNTTISITFALGAVLAAIGAYFYCLRIPFFKYTFGSIDIGIKPFVAAVVGGIGSFPGAMIGGYVIGMIESLIGVTEISKWKDVFVFGILITVLVVKPEGIFGKNVGHKV
ncbi:MAG: branched-chain amino acid ABC transporter permease [Bacilli bacterium]|nr:branched-chain amino acid ABC transporter permease [Bacilli bacterium]